MTSSSVCMNSTSLYLEMFTLEGTHKGQDVNESHFPKEE